MDADADLRDCGCAVAGFGAPRVIHFRMIRGRH
jgi:hypothetical protein